MNKRLISSILAIILTLSCMLPAAAANAPVSSGDINSYVLACENIESQCKYDGQLGAMYTPQSTTFRVWSPLATSVKLNRYSTGSDSEIGARKLETLTMEKLIDASGFTGVWETTVNSDIVNTYYTYSITTPDVKGQNSQTYETQDVYSYAVGVNGDRSMVVDLDATDPQGWENDKHVLWNSSSELFVWEAHIKDFSFNPNSGVSAKNRGKYLAFTENGTTLNGEGNVSTCIDYLKDLGVTTVQLNPFCDFKTVDETGGDDQFNWGYDPKNYNVPEGSYSSNPYDGNVRITECKQMIKALHDAGISVVMDVVYNHTYDSDSSCFGRTVPKYYYRMKENGTYSSGSGCGNDTASERAMFRKFMIDSCTYWANEYHIDGFRFDLMALHDTETMNLIRYALDGIDKRITIWGEGWSASGSEYAPRTCTGTTVYPTRFWDHINLDTRIGFFNDGYRDAIKGSAGNIYAWGWLQGIDEDYACNPLMAGICGQKEYNVYLGTQVVTYDSCHDNTTLWDQLCYSQGMTDYFHKRNDKLVAQNKLAGALLNLSQGTSFILAGEEMGRSKGGNENSYNAPPDVNMIDWSLAETNIDIVSYYKGMRQIRDNFSLFKNPGQTGQGYNFISSGSTLACICTNNTANEWSQLVFVANNTASPKTYQVPSQYNQSWVIVANNRNAGVRELGKVTNGSFTVEPYSIVVAIDSVSFRDHIPSGNLSYTDVEYVNAATDEKLFAYSLSGEVGSQYTACAPSTIGDEYVLGTFSPSAKGTFAEGGSTVKAKYVYTTPGTITVNYYVNGTTSKLKEADVYKARVGDTITLTSIPDFLGYKVNTSKLPETTYKVKYGNTDVAYYYDPVPLNIKINVKHSGSKYWAPVLWVWGRKDGENTLNYCTRQDWAGDKLSDTNGDGWYDMSFTADPNDDCYNLIVSADESGTDQTCDYLGLTQNEIWVVIDDSRIVKNDPYLTIYEENPNTTSSPKLAQSYGSIKYERTESIPKLYNIDSDPYTDIIVSGYETEMSLADVTVEMVLNQEQIPIGKYFNGFELNGEKSGFTMTSNTSAQFMMPQRDVTVRAALEDQENYVIDLENNTTAQVTARISDAIRDLNIYDPVTKSVDLNGDSLPDVSLDPVTNIVTRLNGADYTSQNFTLRVRSTDILENLGWISFKFFGDPYIVSFDANGGTDTMANAEVYPGKSYTLPECTITPPEFKTFDCWEVENVRHYSGDVIPIYEDTQIKALWKDVPMITFDSAGGSGTMNSDVLTNSYYKLPECGFMPPEGCVFSCWRILDKEYKAGETIWVNGSYVAYAQWENLTKHEMIPPTCTEGGTIEYYTDSKGNIYMDKYAAPLTDLNGDGNVNNLDMALPATGHKYGQPIWAWDGTSSATAIFKCENDSAHTKTVNATVSSTYVAATGSAPAQRVYIASVVFEGTSFTDQKTITISFESEDTPPKPIDSDIVDLEPISSDDPKPETQDIPDQKPTNDIPDDPNPDPDPDPNPDPQPDPNPDPDPKPDPDPQPDPNPDPDPKPDPEPGDEIFGRIGEIDGDGSITSGDALEVLRISVGIITADYIKQLLSDVDGDGEVSSGDALQILRYSVSLSANNRVFSEISIKP